MKKIYYPYLLLALLYNSTPARAAAPQPTFSQAMGSYIKRAKKALVVGLGLWAISTRLAQATPASWVNALGGTSNDIGYSVIQPMIVA